MPRDDLKYGMRVMARETLACGQPEKWSPATFQGWHRRLYPIIVWNDSGHREIMKSEHDLKPST